MQIQIGKRRCLKRDQRPGKFAQTCKKLGALLFSILFSSSCALLCSIPKENRKLLLENSLDHVCLSGEGRGKIHYKKAKYAFDFESLLDHLKKKWILALHIHLHGEERFELPWTKEKEQNISEMFFQRISNRQGRENERHLRYLKENLSRFLRFHTGNRWKDKKKKLCLIEKKGTEKVRGNCRDGVFHFSWIALKDRFIIDFPTEDHMVLQIVFFSWQKYFHKIRFSVKENGKSILKMSLFLSECHK